MTNQTATSFEETLKVIASFKTDENTDHAQLLALVQAMANISLETDR